MATKVCTGNLITKKGFVNVVLKTSTFAWNELFFFRLSPGITQKPVYDKLGEETNFYSSEFVRYQ